MTKTVHKLFWAWQYEEEEQWLNEMAAQGWVLAGVGLGRYEFASCQPGAYVVRLKLMDSWPTGTRGQSEVRRIEAMGATHVASWMRWVYFTRPAALGSFELLETTEAKAWHAGRVAALLYPLFFLLTINWLNMWHLLWRFPQDMGTVLGVFLVLTALLMLYTVGVVQLRSRKKQLNQLTGGPENAQEYTVRKWLWVWQFEEEDAWLNEMAARGWVLDSLGFCRYTFVRSQPGEYTVRLQLVENIADKAYIEFIEDTGAEYVGRMAKWIYFRKKTADGPFALFSDIDSRIRQLDQILTMLGVVGILNLVVGGMNLVIGLAGSLPNAAMSVINLGGTLLIAYCLRRIWQKRKPLAAERTLWE